METMMAATQPLGEQHFDPAAEIAPGVSSPDRKRLKTVIRNCWAQAPVNQDKIFQDKIEEVAGRFPTPRYLSFNLEYLDPDKEYYLLPHYDVYEGCYLDLYQRLVVNNSSTRLGKFSTTWSPDLATDQQYVQFYEMLKPRIYNEVPSWADFMLTSKHPHRFILGSDGFPDPSKMQNYEATAYELAQQVCATKLTHEDIYRCMMDVIQETSQVIPLLELTKEFHLHLLDSGYDRSQGLLKYLDWKNGEKIPICRSWEMGAYTDWLHQTSIWSMDKDKKREELERVHKEISDEDCSTRVRYLKLKLKLAEKIGLIVKTEVTEPPEFAISS